MSRYAKVDRRIWNDAKFMRLDDDAKFIFLLLLTHPNMTSLGAMRATVTGLAAEVKWLPERFAKGFSELLFEDMVAVSEKASIVVLPRFLKYNPPENPNVVKAWAGAADLLPECDLKSDVLSGAYAAIKGRGKGFEEAFAKGFGKPFREPSRNRLPNGMPNQEQEQEQEQEPRKALVHIGTELEVSTEGRGH